MKLIIHIGSHKTGSTSIQDYAVQHVELLRAHKIAYPIDFFSKYPQQHSEFRDLLADNNVERVKEFFEYAIRDASSHSAKAVFLSGEDLCTLEKNHVHTLYNMLVNLFTDVKVALVLRNKKEYYWSSYKHSLIWAPPSGENEFLSRHYFSPLYCHESWQNLDKISITILYYENIKDNLLHEFFKSALDIDIGKDDTRIFSNVSLDYLTCQIYNIFLKSFDQADMNKIAHRIRERHASLRFPIEDIIANRIDLNYSDADWSLSDSDVLPLATRNRICETDPEPEKVCAQMIDLFQELQKYFRIQRLIRIK